MDVPRDGSQAPRGTRKAWVETYGCQMNLADGELMQGILAAAGYAPAESIEDADVILVNTCAVREHAERRVLGRVSELNRLKHQRPDLVLGVTGCMAQRMGEDLLARAPYVDLVMGPDGYRRLPEALRAIRGAWSSAEPAVGGAVADRAGGTSQARRTLPVIATPLPEELVGVFTGDEYGEFDLTDATAPEPARLAVLDFEPHENYEGIEIRRESRLNAWVPVQRGCNHRCTFCIVPYVRGSEKNRDPAHILEEVRAIAGSGVPEVTLLGQTVNSYRYGDWDFARLLREVARVDGIRRVRFTSPHPNDVTPELVEVMASEPTVCKQLHLPVQAGNDRTLRRMLRRYTVASFLEKVELVRNAVPDIALSTDVIVAFPGETEAEFEDTLDLMRDVRFDDAFMYKYSPREGTPATRLPPAEFVDPEIAQARIERLIDVQRAIQAEINRGEVGRVEEVLVERVARTPGDVLGRTDRNKVVAFPGDSEIVGSFVRVRLTDTTGATFMGVLVEEPCGDRQVA
ncbi:MAG TPA: MiaB/RimO family radical SAM methylthiotransferase [Longimicrobiales bacterium]|nr:MiaB/RimO family radical SAM methylthiotransferase [Longimicrobiales bacterium]